MTEPVSEPFKFVAGNPALDFTNSVRGWHDGEPHGDHLAGYDQLIAWGEAAGIIDRRMGKRLKVEATQRPREAARVLAQAVELRRTLHCLFSTIAEGGKPAPADLVAVNAALARSVPHPLLVAEGDGFDWGWDDTPALDRVLWPVLRAAGDLLTSDLLPRVRECGGQRCGWLFLDETKNRSRRWCEMSVCGNRAKARRHYTRSRGAATAAG